MKYEDLMREQICKIGHMLWQEGYTPCNSGNICVKLTDGEYLATPTMVNKGLLTPDMILRVGYDPDKPEDERITVLEANRPYSLTSEIKVHLVAMQTVPGSGASIHTHAPYARTMSYLPIERVCVPPECHTVRGVRPWPVVPYQEPGSWALAYGNIEGLKVSHDGVIMGCHGPVAVGADLVTAFQNMEDIEASARNSYLLQVFLGATKNGIEK